LDYQIIDDLADSSPTIVRLIWSKLIRTISSQGVVLWTEGRNQTALHSELQKYQKNKGKGSLQWLHTVVIRETKRQIQPPLAACSENW
jgi:hypothetical protein